ncbi:GntR family transcriptional regulator [Actinocorallia sp. API 0066]|uniref:GntR family transcriptional regulator n=1 Tax=Actinocorallia sp. API 0066 TaxID=2896846 RepID=UPI001E609220|nr:GntR family transcriptional regulator [Actinocorallia sp. API 0066]MCD0451945.1 GntR family transcriptional regulator [Actinocorallia sp. API 0066]
MEFEPPKYARVVRGVQSWIKDGAYRPGDVLPSETQLVKQFAVGRTTVVRALQILQQDGWIHREHGRGSYVRGVPVAVEEARRPALTLIDRPESANGTRVLFVGRARAGATVARHLDVTEGEEVVLRRWVAERDGVPSELASVWVPLSVAEGTNLEDPGPLMVGLRQDVSAFKSMTLSLVRERTSARAASSEEAELLGIEEGAPLLVLLNAYLADVTVAPSLLVELVLPGELHELESSYALP